MRLEDLPPAMQKQVREKAGLREPRKKDRRGDSKAAIDGRCFECGLRFERERDWETHVEESGHRRLVLIGETKETK